MQRRMQQPECDYADVQELPLSWWLSRIAYGFFSRSMRMLHDDICPPGLTLCIDRVSGEVLNERQLLNAELPVMLME